MRAGLLLPLLLTSATLLHAQDEQHRGRKYQPPPPVAHVTITVTKAANGKPVESAAVVFHTFHNGKDQGNLELKTNEEGRAVIDVLPIGDTVRLQVIKSGFQTFGEDYTMDTAVKEISVKMKRPAEQYSIYDKKEGRVEPAPPVAKPPQP
jgi:hypothetical protein